MDRARSRFADLYEECRGFIERDSPPFGISIPYFDSATEHYVCKALITESPPVKLGVIVGGVIHNARSALDHLVWQLVLATGKTPTSDSVQSGSMRTRSRECRSRWIAALVICPRRLEDGQSLRAYIELDDAIDDKPWPSGSGNSYPYVKASGTVYLGREKSKLRDWWQRQQSPSRS